MTLETVLETLCTSGRVAILGKFAPDSCIASTRIACDVLEHFGYTPEPLPCRVRVWTRPLFERLRAKTFDGKFRTGEYSIGIGMAPARITHYNGHLVLRVQDYLVDMSLDQCSRPERGLIVRPHFTRFTRLPAIFLTKKAAAHYEPLPCDDWQTAPDWTNPIHRAPLVRAIIESCQ